MSCWVFCLQHTINGRAAIAALRRRHCHLTVSLWFSVQTLYCFYGFYIWVVTCALAHVIGFYAWSLCSLSTFLFLPAFVFQFVCSRVPRSLWLACIQQDMEGTRAEDTTTCRL